MMLCNAYAVYFMEVSMGKGVNMADMELTWVPPG